MADFIPTVVLLMLAIGGVVVRKTYYSLPAGELKRRAEKHQPLETQLYRAVAYGSSLRGLLWAFIALTSAGGFVLLSRIAPVWLSLAVVIALLWAVYSWLPASRVTRVGARLTVIVTPVVVWLLDHLYPLFSRSTELIQKRYTATAHTGLFERSDLVALIEQQQRQTDSRFSEEELEIAKRALEFNDRKVANVLTSRKALKTVLASDTIGPVLIDELHKAGQRYILVREGSKGPVIGTLAFTDLDLHSNGQVRDIMNDTVYYLHESDSLSEALHAFFVTNHPLFVVVNSFEEYIGIITVENVLHQLLGHVPGDDFDQYADIAAVAARHPKKEKLKKSDDKQKKSDKTPVKRDEEMVK